MTTRAIVPSFDFCQFQRFVNNIGGTPEYRSHEQNAEFEDDRLSQYGFGFWTDIMPHIEYSGNRWLQHPPLPGVYAISVVACRVEDGIRVPFGAEHLLYIGCAKNISNRLAQKNHWLHECMQRLHDWDQMVVVRVLLTTDYIWAERSLIRTLRPILNIQHRNG